MDAPVSAIPWARANATGARSALLAVAVRQTPMLSCAQVRTGLPELMPSVGVVSSLKKRSARNVLQQRVRILSYLNETVDASLKRDAVEACCKELQRNQLWPIVCCARQFQLERSTRGNVWRAATWSFITAHNNQSCARKLSLVRITAFQPWRARTR